MTMRDHQPEDEFERAVERDAAEEWSHTCFNCEESSPLMANAESAHTAAANAGWVMGHYNGQAHYACDACSPLLFDTIPLARMKL